MRTERERRQLKEGKLQVLVVSKDTGRVQLGPYLCRPWWLVLRLRTHPLHEGVVCQAKQRSWVGGGGRGKTETGFVLSRVGNLNAVLNIHD